MSKKTPLSFVEQRRAREHPTELGGAAFQVAPDHRADGLAAMRHHTRQQISRLQEQADLLLRQAQGIEQRAALAETIAQARFAFRPVFLQPYFLYQPDDARQPPVLTLIAPDEWHSPCPYGRFVATVRQLGDSSWEVVESAPESGDG